MKQELKRVDPLRTANVGAVVYGLLMTAFALLFFPFVLLMAVLARDGAGVAGGFGALAVIVVYPVMGVVMGWISGLLTSVIYNFVIRWTGGLLLEFDTVPSAPVPTASQEGGMS